MDDPRHLGKFQKSLSTRITELNHMLLFQGMSKIQVHCYNFLLSTLLPMTVTEDKIEYSNSYSSCGS